MLLRGPYDIIHYARFSREKWQVPDGFIERESRFEQCLKREVGAKKKKKQTQNSVRQLLSESEDFRW